MFGGIEQHAELPALQRDTAHLCLQVGPHVLALLSTAELLAAVCTSLDASAGTHFCEDHSQLLSGAPTGVEDARRAMAAAAAAGRRGERTHPCSKFEDPAFWRAVQRELLPRLRRGCERLAQRAQQGQQGPPQDAALQEVAVAAVTCSNPGCLRLQGQRECDLGLRRCAGCLEARYCCRWAGQAADRRPALGLAAGPGACLLLLLADGAVPAGWVRRLCLAALLYCEQGILLWGGLGYRAEG
jgi:hypothetical protein